MKKENRITETVVFFLVLVLSLKKMTSVEQYDSVNKKEKEEEEEKNVNEKEKEEEEKNVKEEGKEEEEEKNVKDKEKEEEEEKNVNEKEKEEEEEKKVKEKEKEEEKSVENSKEVSEENKKSEVEAERKLTEFFAGSNSAFHASLSGSKHSVLKKEGIFYFRCPICNILITCEDKQLNCRIFRCGVMRNNQNQPIPPHASREQCEAWKKTDSIVGCTCPIEVQLCDSVHVEWSEAQKNELDKLKKDLLNDEEECVFVGVASITTYDK